MKAPNPDGTIDVLVTLTVRVDPKAWAARMMGTHPDETLQRDVRAHVKRFVRDVTRELAGAEAAYDPTETIPIETVTVEGIYDGSPVNRRA